MNKVVNLFLAHKIYFMGHLSYRGNNSVLEIIGFFWFSFSKSRKLFIFRDFEWEDRLPSSCSDLWSMKMISMYDINRLWDSRSLFRLCSHKRYDFFVTGIERWKGYAVWGLFKSIRPSIDRIISKETYYLTVRWFNAQLLALV